MEALETEVREACYYRLLQQGRVKPRRGKLPELSEQMNESAGNTDAEHPSLAICWRD